MRCNETTVDDAHFTETGTGAHCLQSAPLRLKWNNYCFYIKIIIFKIYLVLNDV